MSTNRARQLLALPKHFGRHANVPLHEAIDLLVNEANAPDLRERLYLMIATLPTQVHEQATDVLGGRYVEYHHEVERVIGHFRAHSLASSWAQYVAVYERHVVISLTAISHLVDDHLHLSVVDEQERQSLEETIRSLINDIAAEPDMDEDVRSYLLSVALHLLQAIQQYEVFGADAVVDIHGRFVVEAMYQRPRLGGPLREATVEMFRRCRDSRRRSARWNCARADRQGTAAVRPWRRRKS